jgi:hypothetical protein
MQANPENKEARPAEAKRAKFGGTQPCAGLPKSEPVAGDERFSRFASSLSAMFRAMRRELRQGGAS